MNDEFYTPCSIIEVGSPTLNIFLSYKRLENSLTLLLKQVLTHISLSIVSESNIWSLIAFLNFASFHFF